VLEVVAQDYLDETTQLVSSFSFQLKNNYGSKRVGKEGKNT